MAAMTPHEEAVHHLRRHTEARRRADRELRDQVAPPEPDQEGEDGRSAGG